MNTVIFISYGLVVAFVSLRQMGTIPIEQSDKLGHLLIYAIFSWLAFRVSGMGTRFYQLSAGIILYGALLELAQSQIPGRFMSFYDLLANTLGVVLMVLFLRKVYNKDSAKL